MAPGNGSKVANVMAEVLVQGFLQTVTLTMFGVEATEVLKTPNQIGPVDVVGRGAVMQVIPGGAIDAESGRWHRSRNAFFLPVRALSRLFRGKFLALMKASDLYALIPESVWLQEWNVNCQSVPSADATLNYLAPYLLKNSN